MVSVSAKTENVVLAEVLVTAVAGKSGFGRSLLYTVSFFTLFNISELWHSLL